MCNSALKSIIIFVGCVTASRPVHARLIVIGLTVVCVDFIQFLAFPVGQCSAYRLEIKNITDHKNIAENGPMKRPSVQ